MTDLFAAARESRNDAIDRADRHADEAWKAEALETIRRVARERPDFLVDDLWATGLEKPGEARAMGPMLQRAESLGWIERTGLKRPSAQPGNHMNLRAVWRSRLYHAHWKETENREAKARALAAALWAGLRRLDASVVPSEHAATLKRKDWEAIARAVNAKNPPSDTTVTRVIELLREAERLERAS